MYNLKCENHTQALYTSCITRKVILSVRHRQHKLQSQDKHTQKDRAETHQLTSPRTTMPSPTRLSPLRPLIPTYQSQWSPLTSPCQLVRLFYWGTVRSAGGVCCGGESGGTVSSAFYYFSSGQVGSGRSSHIHRPHTLPSPESL